MDAGQVDRYPFAARVHGDGRRYEHAGQIGVPAHGFGRKRDQSLVHAEARLERGHGVPVGQVAPPVLVHVFAAPVHGIWHR
jgi:hypothetical protein